MLAPTPGGDDIDRPLQLAPFDNASTSGAGDADEEYSFFCLLVRVVPLLLASSPDTYCNFRTVNMESCLAVVSLQPSLFLCATQ